MDLIIVAVIVFAAAAFVGWKVWGMVKPGPKTVGCSCGSAKSGCGGCPLVKR
ncbi:MAG TPA: FeoB-associated Cys-rich membrane protein [Spirochaetia bacterium]|jgi:hypothetical protein|nr:FeoB-associated Cys-rich membrane protein [Spirochaetia bacterium]